MTVRENEERIDNLETAFIQVNHFTETMLEWKGEMSTNMKWVIRILVGSGLLALINLINSVFFG